MKKVFFIGGSGLLAVNWTFQIMNDFQVILGFHNRSISIKGVETVFLDCMNNELLTQSIEKYNPDIVINCAGLTSIELCEKKPLLAYQINAEIAKNVAQICANLNIKFVHISTDHLYSGIKSFVTETEPADPVNIYASSKFEGDKRVFEANPNALIIRTNFYGWGTSYRKSFSDFIINKLRLGEIVELFEDVFYTPIIIEELVKSIHELINDNASGIYNVVGDDRISKYEFGRKIAEKFNLNLSLLKPLKFSERKDLVIRPLDLSLSNKKISTQLNKKIGGIEEHITKLYNQEKTGHSLLIHKL